MGTRAVPSPPRPRVARRRGIPGRLLRGPPRHHPGSRSQAAAECVARRDPGACPARGGDPGGGGASRAAGPSGAAAGPAGAVTDWSRRCPGATDDLGRARPPCRAAAPGGARVHRTLAADRRGGVAAAIPRRAVPLVAAGERDTYVSQNTFNWPCRRVDALRQLRPSLCRARLLPGGPGAGGGLGAGPGARPGRGDPVGLRGPAGAGRPPGRWPPSSAPAHRPNGVQPGGTDPPRRPTCDRPRTARRSTASTPPAMRRNARRPAGHP